LANIARTDVQQVKREATIALCNSTHICNITQRLTKDYKSFIKSLLSLGFVELLMKELDELDLNDEEYISIILLAVENVLIFDQDLA